MNVGGCWRELKLSTAVVKGQGSRLLGRRKGKIRQCGWGEAAGTYIQGEVRRVREINSIPDKKER
uniref:Uncharacterized protein n=1 Tax=Candidozyma auris TaxID=498019 RepID=A0A0L0NQB5_CANAR